MPAASFARALVPLDGSTLAERGLEYALLLAGPLGLPVALLRVAPGPEQHAEVVQYLETAAGRVRAAGLTASPEARQGDPVQEILAAQRDGDLLVMASHGASGLERFLLGGVADRVLRHGRAPVFLARAFKPVVDVLSPITVALDGSERAEAILPYVRLLARALDAEIKIVRAAYVRAFDAVAYPSQIVQMTLEWERGEGARYVEALVETLTREGFRARGSIVEQEPAQAVIEAAAKERGGVIAMTTRGRSGLARTMLGSVASRVSEGAEDPVLLVRA